MICDEALLKPITEKIIGCAFRVHNELGSGFLEKVYENALLMELRSAGLMVDQQVPIPVFYKGQCVGAYEADLIVEGSIILELKAVTTFAPEHTAQAIHYLAATKHPLCLLVNFGKSVEVKRIAGKTLIPA